VVVPARNEEAALPRLLAALADQTLPADELVVVDDHSDDATAAVAAAGGATVVTPPPLPGDWVGKTWACHHGAAATTAALLVFLDADVDLAPDALARLVGEHRRAGGGLVSVQPSHRTLRAHEQLSAVCNVVAMMGTGAFTAPPAPQVTMAFGPCMVIGRDDYEAAGGHAAATVRRQVAEDIAIARRVRATGAPVTVLAGADLVGFRMYPEGVGQLAEGWTKMLGNGGRLTSPPLQAAVGVWVTGGLAVSGRAVALLARIATGRGLRPGDGATALCYGLWALEMGWLFRRVGRWARWTAPAFPVPLAAFVALFTRSATLLVRGRPARWRGRPVPAS
jgi:4,4'-diaponeurosporenoate glycosyltransferase